jgi:hypothetical protein
MQPWTHPSVVGPLVLAFAGLGFGLYLVHEVVVTVQSGGDILGAVLLFAAAVVFGVCAPQGALQVARMNLVYLMTRRHSGDPGVSELGLGLGAHVDEG